MRKHLFVILAILFITVFAFSGCASGSQSNDTASSDGDYYGEMSVAEEPAVDMDYAEASMDDKADYEEDAGGNAATGTNIDIEDTASILEPGVDRKIVYNGYIEAQTKNFDADYDHIIDSLKSAGGYVENAYMYGTAPEDWQDSGRTAELTVRIPSDKFDSFMEMLKGMGENLSSSVSGQDISLQYYDTETRLRTLRARQERLIELLAQAADPEDIIEIDRELSNVQTDIDLLEGSLRDYDSLVNFSTVTISLREVNEITRVTSSDDSIGTRIKNGFYSVLNVLADIGEGLLIVIIAGSPIIVPLAAIIVLIVFLVRRSNRKHLKKQAENHDTMNKQ
jgi:hypothetical protein